jgi:hypothetical protein
MRRSVVYRGHGYILIHFCNRFAELRANPTPKSFDLLRSLAATGVLSNAEAGSDRILKIDARRQHRLGENAKAH